MDIMKQASLLNKQIEKLHYQLTSWQALSEQKRKQKQDQIDTLETSLKALQAQLTKLVITKEAMKTLE